MTIFDIKFNENHDLGLFCNDLAFAQEEDIVKQRLTIRLQFLLGEWFLDNRVGLPYTQFIFEKGSDISDIYTLIDNEIRNTEGVENIKSLDLSPSPDNRSLRVDFEVNDGISQGSLEVSV